MTETAVTCDLCGSDAYEVVYPSTLKRSLGDSDFTVMGELGEYPRIVRCRGCGLIYANPRDDGEDLADKYRSLSVAEYLSAEESRRVIAAKDAAFVRSVKPGGRLLDVGCSAGIFLSALDEGYQKTGIEPSRAASEAARQRLPDARIYNAILDDVSLEPGAFDIVTLWDVVEHLPSPRAALLRIHDLLAEDGVLVLVTPDIGSFLARLMRRRWTHLIRGHIFYFTRTSIADLARQTGFSVVSTANYKRYFKLSYILERIGLWPNFPDGLKTVPPFSLTLPVDFGDAMLVVMRKT